MGELPQTDSIFQFNKNGVDSSVGTQEHNFFFTK